MCDECGGPERNYTWIRDREGVPKKMRTGGYVMQNEYGACFGFNVKTLHIVRDLLDEIEALENELL